MTETPLPPNAGPWLDPAEDPRETQTSGEDERSILLDYLRRYRLTLELKCDGLDAEQLARRSVPPSTMSLLGVLRHLTEVERYWFRVVMAGLDVDRLWPPFGRDWHDARNDDAMVAEAWRAWHDEVAFAEDWIIGIEDLGLIGTTRHGEPVPLRDVLVHMVEEYARHCGHADLLREAIDGRVGL